MDCIFCKIVSGKLPAQIVFRDEAVTAFTDIHPAAPTHILVIPNRHVATLDDLDDVELAGRLLMTCQQVAREAGIVDGGYRVVNNVGSQGGQHVYHIHLHVLGGRRLGWPPG